MITAVGYVAAVSTFTQNNTTTVSTSFTDRQYVDARFYFELKINNKLITNN